MSFHVALADGCAFSATFPLLLEVYGILLKCLALTRPPAFEHVHALAGFCPICRTCHLDFPSDDAMVDVSGSSHYGRGDP